MLLMLSEPCERDGSVQVSHYMQWRMRWVTFLVSIDLASKGPI